MKCRSILLSIFTVSLVLFTAFYFMSGISDPVMAQASKKDEKKIVKKMIEELNREKEQIDSIRASLEQRERNLNAFQSELDRKNSDYIARLNELKKKEEEFLKKVEGRSFNKQIIQTYESIEAESAALLIRDLYEKSPENALMVLRKLEGKKAGRIMEALVQVDRKKAAEIAEKVLNFYKPSKTIKK